MSEAFELDRSASKSISSELSEDLSFLECWDKFKQYMSSVRTLEANSSIKDKEINAKFIIYYSMLFAKKHVLKIKQEIDKTNTA